MKITDNSTHFLHAIRTIPVDRSPYMLFDLDQFQKNCEVFKKLFPRISLLYAIKAFYSPRSLEVAKGVVDGFDVASPNEAASMIKNNIDPLRIEVSNPVKSIKSIQDFTKLGIKHYTVQSKDEIDKIYRINERAVITVRIKVNDGYSLVPLSDKFGCDPFYAPELLQYAQNIGLVARGVSFHVGSQLLDLEYWESAIRLANNIIKTAQKNGVKANLVNIGGGFCAKYFDTDPSIENTAKIINAALDPTIEYVAEPGRYLVANAAVTVATVISVEKRKEENWIFVDTGRFHSFLGADRYEIFPYIPTVLSGSSKVPKARDQVLSAILTGPTCDSQDIITDDVSLPIDIATGDILVFPNTGAYTTVYGSNFNGFLPPEIINISNQKVEEA